MLFLIFYKKDKYLYVLYPDFLDTELPSFSVLMDEDNDIFHYEVYQCLLP